MANKRKPWRSTVAGIAFLIPIAAIVVYFSLQVSNFECDVCISFNGREVCRTVIGKTEEEGLRTGIDNACAPLAGGVTETLRCSRTTPTKAECRRLN